jgi:hypothetical protein
MVDEENHTVAESGDPGAEHRTSPSLLPATLVSEPSERLIANPNSVVVTSDSMMKRLKADVLREHGLVLHSQATMLIHAMNAGEALLLVKKNLSATAFREWLSAVDQHGLSLSLRTAQRYMQVAAGAEEIQRLRATGAGRRADAATRDELLHNLSVRQAIAMLSRHDAANPRRVRTHGRVDPRVLTPRPILEATVRCVGSLTLDPAADPEDPDHTGATVAWGPEEDGLCSEREWTGTVFVHPPHDSTKQWIERALEEFGAGHAEAIVLLIAANADSPEFRMLNNFPRVFLHERPGGFAQPANLILVGSAVKPKQLAAAFRDLGDTYVPVG